MPFSCCNRSTILAVMILGAASLAGAETAVPAADPHAGHKVTTEQGGAPDSPATAAFKAASDRMHATMAFPYTGNPDIDFIKGMVPHHQGAVDAARIVLQYGTDPDVRKFAETVIAAQEAEITWMNDWLAKQPQ